MNPLTGARGLLIASLLASVAPRVEAQNHVLTGRVRTRSGAPIAEAHVRVVRHQAQALTDAAGAFRLRLSSSHIGEVPDTVRVERLGFASVAVPLASSGDSTALVIEMVEVALRLDDVVVTATAGTLTRRAQAGVVATIPVSELLQTVSLQTLPEVLLGRVTSLDVTPSSGSSGEAQRIWLRGATSIGLSNEPIFFVDGIRADARIHRLLPNPGGQASSRLFDLDPADIDRIEVVKGPAAAAIYGADASAGVIQVFTKRGALGREGISQDVQIETGWLDAAYTAPDNFARCRATDTTPTSPAILCRGLPVGTLVSDNPLRRTGMLSTGGLRGVRWSASGGGANYGVHAALSTSGENGTLPQNEFDRHQFRLSSRWIPRRSLTIEPGFALLRTKTSQPQNGDSPVGLLPSGSLGSPLTVGTLVDGAFQVPLSAVATIEQVLQVTRAMPSLRVAHESGRLQQRIVVGMDATSSVGRYFVPLRTDNAFTGQLAGGVVREDHQTHELFTLDYAGTIRVLDRAGVSNRVSVGAQFVDLWTDDLTAIGRGLASNFANRVNDAATRNAFQTHARTRSLGTYIQDEIAWRDRLFLQAALRSDRHSAFGSEAGASLFPKVGVSYVVVDQSARSRLPSAISTARVRVAFGRSGRAPRQGLAGTSYGSAPAMYGPTTVGPGLTPLNPGNPALRPERGSELEAGVDVGLLRDRFAIELTHFNKVVRDLLASIPQRPSIGFPQAAVGNLGAIRNRGLEATLRLRGDVAGRSIDSHLGISTLRSVVLDPGPIATTAPVRFQRGRPVGAWFDYRVVSTDTLAVVTDTAEYVGPSMPTGAGFIGSTVGLTKSISLRADFDGKWGYLEHNLDDMGRDRFLANSERALQAASWTADERLRRFGPFVNSARQPVSSFVVLGPYLQDASFLRWRQLAITFDLARLAPRVLPRAGASATISAQNLALWTRFEGDPEIVTYISENALGGTVQYGQPVTGTMPQSRRLTARLNFRF